MADDKDDLRVLEYGYTPNNLKYEIKRMGTRKAFAELHGINPQTLNGYCLPSQSKGHRDMPHKVWLGIINYCNDD